MCPPGVRTAIVMPTANTSIQLVRSTVNYPPTSSRLYFRIYRFKPIIDVSKIPVPVDLCQKYLHICRYSGTRSRSGLFSPRSNPQLSRPIAV